MAVADTGVRGAVEAARRRITGAAERAGRDTNDVRLIAVTKTVDVARISEAFDAGVVDFGENRVQEALAKREQLPESLRWHLIGHLQTNKAGKAASAFVMVHSVDSERVAQALAARRPPELGDLDVCLEVELTGIPGRTGFGADELLTGFAAVTEVERLRVVGLMTMAALVDDVELARPTFAHLRRLRDDLEQRSGGRLPVLSMGMSNDFEVAVEEGATVVRLGRVIFGERPMG
jgi:hypothetical protein